MFLLKIGILYQTVTGNTEIIAKKIAESLSEHDIILCDVTQETIPQADFYFIGFGVRNYNCSMRMIDVFEQLSNTTYALFLTCGLYPSEKYKQALYNAIEAWLPDNSVCQGVYVCQAPVPPEVQIEIINKSPHSRDLFIDMFANGENHPDEEDFTTLRKFVNQTLVGIS